MSVVKWWVALLLLTGLCSCAAGQRADPFLGKHIADILAVSPPPTQIISDERGGRIFVWQTINEPKHFISIGGAKPLARLRLETTMLYVNADGVVYRWREFRD